MFTTAEHSTVYVPLYVTPLLSIKNPPTPGSQTEMFAVALFPEHPLQVGDAVQLHLLSRPSQSDLNLLETCCQMTATPLGIRGKISGERERSEQEVEFVIKNDDEEAGIRRAFVRASADLRMSATPKPPARKYRLRRAGPRAGQGEKGGQTVDALSVTDGPGQGAGDLGELGASPHVREGRAQTGRPRGLQQAGDRGRWVVYSPMTMEAMTSEQGGGGERAGPRTRAWGAAGSSRDPPKDAPSGRSRRAGDNNVGKDAGRGPDARARQRKDLCPI
ncbi:hypothetical protein TRAPUB_7740 [Trametes pubescens]|uniref:Uncharacterized protein n=1 Tax=Trametes pubescens TaxID=154538 RepID=A0A1M2V2L7_TRAPU|nr:hypothetical protein TRAPUB_7740 [Trametes pubescens]